MNRVALVTGASRNIGFALTKDLVDQGLHVIGVARDSAALHERFEASGFANAAEAAACDLSERASCLALIDQVLGRHGRVDVLINNAVHRATYPLWDHPYDEWQRVLDVTLSGAFSLIQGFAPGMMAAGWGRIINVAGLSGQRGSQHRAAVVAAKSGLLGLTKAVALEVGGKGVTVNAVSPGPIDTERDAQTSSGDADRVRRLYRERNSTTPVGRRGRIEDVVDACRYLASEGAAYVTGQTLSVNGGLLMP